MQAAGFHFGHDASGALVDGGGLRRFLDKERRSRVKHAIGLSADDLREILAGAGDDTLVGLSSTQGLPLFPDPGVGLTLDGGKSANAAAYFQRLPADHPYHKFITWMPDLAKRDGVLVEEGLFPHRSRLNEGANRSYETLGMVAGQFTRMAQSQQRDGTLTLDGQTYRARFYQHHFLHAQYAAWTGSPTAKSLVITGDGGIGPSFWGGGVYFWTPGEKLLPVTPSDAWLGWFYDTVSSMVGFGQSGGAGKLMGLAPYGRPLYLDASMIGTRLQVSDGYRLSMPQIIQRWLGKFGIDSTALPTWDLFKDRPPTVIADIAASAQLIIELNIQELARAAVAIAQRADFAFENITLSGGVALNCPANSNLAVTLNTPVLVPPAINDEGLSIAAAVAAYFDQTGAYPTAPRDYAEAAYIGSDVSQAEIEAAAATHGFTRATSKPSVQDAADALLRGDAVGVCVGRAEVGPRALGHRSILANPGLTDSWEAVNHLKLREPWRPFAPAVLKERSPDYFDRGPDESRFMLFNYRCNSKMLPATTHYDHSSRVQHVSPETGILYDVLVRLEQLGAPPVVLNTSFNGPGVPIVDSAEDAFAEAAKLGIKHILTDFGFYSAP
ncbi:MAG: carbamoyltransferase C-terminal domain-containing protein [Pseudomonadota bacterium]